MYLKTYRVKIFDLIKNNFIRIKCDFSATEFTETGIYFHKSDSPARARVIFIARPVRLQKVEKESCFSIRQASLILHGKRRVRGSLRLHRVSHEMCRRRRNFNVDRETGDFGYSRSRWHTGDVSFTRLL